MHTIFQLGVSQLQLSLQQFHYHLLPRLASTFMVFSLLHTQPLPSPPHLPFVGPRVFDQQLKESNSDTNMFLNSFTLLLKLRLPLPTIFYPFGPISIRYVSWWICSKLILTSSCLCIFVAVLHVSCAFLLSHSFLIFFIMKKMGENGATVMKILNFMLCIR